jgi:hypothetical protein
MRNVLIGLAVLSAIEMAGCSGSSPAQPSPSTPAPSSPTTGSLEGQTVSAIGRGALPRITVQVGTAAPQLSDASGHFHVDIAGQGRQDATATGAAIVGRRTGFMVPSSDAVTLSLIPASFDLVSFDQMFRTTNDWLQRWTTAPKLVIITSILVFTSKTTGSFPAESEQIPESDLVSLTDDLVKGLAALTGDSLSYSSIERERVAAGKMVTVAREGQIVVGRYRGITGLTSTVGFGRWADQPDGEVVGGSVYLDKEFDTTSEQRRSLRIHELGHALGYNHVTGRSSVMNPTVGVEPTEFDRQGASIAFQRAPGNRSPDIDPTTTTISSVASAHQPRWSARVP